LSDPAQRFYDWLASEYQAVYADWEASLQRQAEVLDRLIAEELGPGPHRVLDCTCGIGTQALGLAGLGHVVVGTDISSESIGRARAEAERRGLEVDFRVADLRTLSLPGEPAFDVVLSADNALPHLVDRADLRRGLERMIDQVAPHGLLLASMRDYDAILAERPSATPPTCSMHGDERRVTFQLWEWSDDGRRYELEMFLMRETSPGRWTTESRRAAYRAMPRAELTTLLRELGAESVRWRMPAESGFFQPIVTARRAG